jgi:hypothetical protein
MGGLGINFLDALVPSTSLKIGVTYPGRYRVVDTLSRETSLGGYPSPPIRIVLGIPVSMPKSAKLTYTLSVRHAGCIF